MAGGSRPPETSPETADLALREQAWIGDAVLALYAREQILARQISFAAGADRLFQEMTSNHFLNRFGRPTEIEAWIGEIYLSRGLEEARQALNERFGPHFERILRRPPE